MPLILRLTKGTALTHQELDDNFTYLDSLISGSSSSTADGVISNVSLANDYLTFTGTGGGFSGSIDLSEVNSDTIDYVSSVTYSSGSLSFTGIGNAQSGSVDISGVNTDTRDYVSSVAFANNVLSFTGTGDATDATIDLSSLASSGGIALTDLGVTAATASGGGSLSYNSSTGAFTFAPAVIPNTYGIVTASNSSLTGVLSPASTNDYLYFKGGSNVTITTTTTNGVGNFAGLTLDTLTFDVDLSSVSGSTASEIGHTYLQLLTNVTIPGEIPTPLLWGDVNNANASSSFQFGNTSNILTTQLAQGTISVATSTFLKINIASFNTITANNVTLTYSLQTSPSGQGSWTTQKTVQRTKSAAGSFADSFWSIFKVDAGTDIRVIVNGTTGNMGTIDTGTQLEIIELG